MLNCKELVQVLNNSYNGSYDNFQLKLCFSIEEYIKKICDGLECDPMCCVIKNLTLNEEPVHGIACDYETILYDQSVFDKVFSGDKFALVLIFHELVHIDQKAKMEKGVSTPNVIMYIKDLLLDEYFESKRQDYEFGKNDYYYTNWNLDSSEVDADLNAILLTIKFLMDNKILNIEEYKALLKGFEEVLKRKTNKRILTNCLSDGYFCLIDDIFDQAIKDNPNWLNDFVQLNVEYHIDDGHVVKNEYIEYQEYDETSDLYHKNKYLKKEKLTK